MSYNDLENITLQEFSDQHSRKADPKGKPAKFVSDVGFHPAKAALGVRGNLNSPVLNNIGYVVIVLKKQKNSSEMPEYVEGRLTAKIKYDIKNAFGIGDASFYLSELNDEEWEDKQIQYGFWDGRGYLRAESINDDGAVISIYDDVKKISTVSLEKGETSKKIYLPGFDCLAGLELKLNGFEVPDTRIKLRVGSDVVEVKEKENFLENNCYVVKNSIKKQGLVQEIKIRCKGEKAFSLSISPRVILDFDGAKEEGYGIGDQLYEVEGKNKFVYLGYIGETFDGTKFIIPVVSPAKNSEEFKNTQIYKRLHGLTKIAQQDTGNFLLNLMKGAFSVSGGGLYNFGNFLITGSYPVGWIYEKSSGKNEMSTTEMIVRGVIALIPGGAVLQGLELLVKKGVEELKNLKEMDFIGFAGAQNRELGEEGYYEKAMRDYDNILDSFSSEEYIDGANEITYGEQALYRKIILAWDMDQKKTVIDLCGEFKERYPKSKKNLNLCDDEYKLSSSVISSENIMINGRVRTISFEGIYEPSFEEYGAEVFVSGEDEKTGKKIRESKRLVKGAEVFLLGGDSIELIELDEDSIKIKLSIRERVGELMNVGTTKTIKLDDYEANLGKNKYKIRVDKINLKKIAKVSVISNIDNAGTEANFSFKIGIEKRSIKLSPEKTLEIIEGLNETIEKWTKISDDLGKVVKGLKTACLGVGAMLTVKNFFANTGGKAIARQEVMRGEGGWYARCADGYDSVDECLNDNADEIDKDVEVEYKAMQKVNEKMKKIQSEVGVTEGLFGEKVYDEDEVLDGLRPEIFQDLENYGEGMINPNNPDESIKFSEGSTIHNAFSNKKKNQYLYLDDLRDIKKDFFILEDDPKNELAKARIYSKLYEIQETSEVSVERETLAEELKKSNLELGVTSYGEEGSIVGTYSGGTIVSNQIEGVNLEDKNEEGKEINYPVEIITYNGKKYVAVLERANRDYIVDKVYDYEGIKNGIIQVGEERKDIVGKFKSFKKYDRTSYENTYKASLGESYACLRYYETEPYKGLPAIVPFDLKNGWYAYVGQTLPVFGGIKSYDESGRVTSFWVCNVGENEIEENKGGDDICQMINTGTGQPYNTFAGLSPGDASKVIRDAQEAVEEASRKYKSASSGKSVRINGQDVRVCNPAVDIPEMKCQDFMSPKDCNLLFNVCDPVICPSSRCDFGGAYPVKDVVQSGIIGSIVLCLPNIKEGIYIPVCLTGIKAGVDGFLSIFTSYRDCLQHSLDTGEMIGVCDEIYSVYMCEFLWKQALPLAKIMIPKMMEMAMGQNTRGGGEYLGVQSAWDNAENSVNYFTDYYAANSYDAFKARSAEDIGGEICKSYVSGVFPDGGNLLDSLTEPDSPTQFHGRFDEMPFTSATVPPISQYKVFYHIYAGKDSGVYYRVYLKGSSESSFYQDTATTRMVDSGYIASGGYASETKDFTAPSGYQEMCIMVNNQEPECGFKQVSTNFAVNYVEDKYLASQAGETNIKTETGCIAGSASAYSLLTPNLQGGADEVINPAIYDRGIIRICATDNPGKGTDAKSGGEGARWLEVGYCGDKKIKCWLDTKSVKDVIEVTTIEKEVLDGVTDDYLEVLRNRDGYISQKDFFDEIEKIKGKKGLEQIDLINELLEKVFYNSEKARLHLLRGDAYAGLVRKPEIKTIINEEEIDEEEIFDEEEEEKFVDYNSLVFEFKDGKPDGNLYYKYSNQGWEWYVDEEPWRNIQEMDVEDKKWRDWYFGEKNEKFIKLLKKENPNFEQGLNLLIERTLEDDEGKTMLGSWGTELSTENVELSHKGIFTVGKKGATPLYFRHKNDEWEWSFDKKNWMNVQTIVVKGGKWDGKKPVQSTLELINSLNEMGFDEGAVLIFTNAGVVGDGGVEIGEDILKLTDPRQRVLRVVEELDESSAAKDIIKEYLCTEGASCWSSVMYVYKKAGVEAGVCSYSDEVGKKYSLEWEKDSSGDNKKYVREMGISKNDKEQTIFLVYPDTCRYNSGDVNVKQKYDKIQPGDILSIVSDPWNGHNVIFIKWVDERKGIAKLFGWQRNEQNELVFGYQITDISETGNHPVYVIFNPTISGITKEASKEEEPEKVEEEDEKITALKTYKIDSVEFKQENNKIILNVEHGCDIVKYEINSNKVHLPLDIGDETIFGMSTLTGGTKTFNLFNPGKYYAKIYCYKIDEEGKEKRRHTMKSKGVLEIEASSEEYQTEREGIDRETYNLAIKDVESQIEKNIGEACGNKERTRGGIYAWCDNFELVNKIYNEGMLSEKEYEEMKKTGLFTKEKDMVWLKELLEEKRDKKIPIIKKELPEDKSFVDMSQDDILDEYELRVREFDLEQQEKERESSSVESSSSSSSSSEDQTGEDLGNQVLELAEKLEGTIVIPERGENCFSAVMALYKKLGFNHRCVYTDNVGREYTFANIDTDFVKFKEVIGNSIFAVPESVELRSACKFADFEDFPERDKLDQIQPGDLLSIIHSEGAPHNVIFIKWINKETRLAKVFDWMDYVEKGQKVRNIDKEKRQECTDDLVSPKSKNKNKYEKEWCHVYTYRIISLKDNRHPVYIFWTPVR